MKLHQNIFFAQKRFVLLQLMLVVLLYVVMLISMLMSHASVNFFVLTFVLPCSYMLVSLVHEDYS